MSPAERALAISRYAEGPAVLEAAFATIPPAARQWRPRPGAWSSHEIVLHCADSETNAHMRIRYLLAEADPLILGYDQDRWATILDYHALPLEPAFVTIRAVRANTLPLLHRLTDAQWARTGRHTERPSYGVEPWLETYAEHLEVHARQLGRNLAAWGER